MNGSHLVLEARRRAGLTQAELADAAGTSQSSIARLESGRTSPSMERISELLRACGYELQVHLVPVDDDEWSMTRRNLGLSPTERIVNATNAARFLLASRVAMDEAR